MAVGIKLFALQKGILMPITVELLGDSTLDNIFWVMKDGDIVEGRKKSVEGKLQERGVQVINHAFDGFTTDSVLGQDSIGSVLPSRDSFAPNFAAYMKERAPNKRWVSPLKDLQKTISQRPNDRHYVAISVGGNDFRVNLASPWALIKDIPQIQARYMQIVEKVKGLQGRDIKPILIFQYRTDAKNDLPYLIYTVFGVLGAIAVAIHLACIALLTAPIWFFTGHLSLLAAGTLGALGALGLYGSHKIVPLSVTTTILRGNKISMVMISKLMERFYQPILEMAKKERIPILDLPNTFNPYHDLYVSNIEPNEKGAQLIAEGIHHIVGEHDFEGESKLYAKPNGQGQYAGVLNAADWKVAMPSKG